MPAILALLAAAHVAGDMPLSPGHGISRRPCQVFFSDGAGIGECMFGVSDEL
jgi:hypothetical protein